MFPFEDQLRQTLNQLLLGFAGAIEYWTVACLSQGDLGDPREFVDTQWASLMNEVHETRVLIAKWPHEPPEVVHEQLAGLMTACSDLREIFETFLQAPECGSAARHDPRRQRLDVLADASRVGQPDLVAVPQHMLDHAPELACTVRLAEDEAVQHERHHQRPAL